MPARNFILLVVVTVASVAAWFARQRDARGQRVNEVLALVDAAYIDPVDDEALVDAAVDGAVSMLDEHSAFLRGDGQRELEAALDQQFGGVGLELAIDDRTGELTVAMPLAGGPAWEAGIVSGDRIKAIDGTSTAGLPLRDAVARLRGEPGQPVTLTVASPSEPAGAQPVRDVRLIREVVEIESVQGDRRRADGSWDWWLEAEPGVALLRMTGFGERTAAELDTALAQVASGQLDADGVPTPLRGIIIDLRGNPGGLLSAAVDVCDRFLDEGVIVSTRGRRLPAVTPADETAPDVRQATPGAAVEGVPIAVLVDGLTASSAEIVAACLQDHGRATVVGGRTYGKGTVQSILPLGGGGLLKLTTSEYLRPSGATINRRPDDADDAAWGVTPDAGFVVVPTGDAVDRLARWRRLRDRHPTVTLSGGSAAAAPRAVDEVLARALEAFPAGSVPEPELGGEKEAAGDAHEAAPAGV
jgi:carboxyl-terminal processing protease